MQLTVFISSRMNELEKERAAVGEAVSELWTHENLPFTIWGWEGAKEIPSGKHPDEVQSKGVRDSDIYVLILGSEYGDFEYGESPTHKEYEIACSEREQDCILIYIQEVERKREEKLEKWIEEIKNRHTFKSFKSSDQLKDLVKTRLRDLWNKGIRRAGIPTIQLTLRKGETLEGDFFKKEPEWIDFEEGFVVERKEVDKIIKKLEKNNIQLVLGEPASGKSVILKNIGFKLANENKDVYFVELKKLSRDEVKCYFDDILEIKDEKTVFIVDDAHLLPSECERLVRDFKNMNLKAKLIIGSRETQEIKRKYPKEASEFEYLRKTKTCTPLHGKDVTDEMIKRFLKREHREYNFSDKRIERVSRNLEKYKKDLWFLSWALKAYNPEKDSVEEKEIYDKVKNSIRNISAGKGKLKINAEDVFLPLSVFYRFEIPVERWFLEEQNGIEENIINQLIALSEIIETEEREKRRTISLNHSSIADLYFKTYMSYPDLGGKIKKIFQGEDAGIEYHLFCQYIKSTPTNSLDVVTHLGSVWKDEKGGHILLKKLIEDIKVKNSLKKSIAKEKDMNKIEWCVRRVAEASEEVALKLVDAVSSRIETENDIEKIGRCVRHIAWTSKEAGLKLANCIDINILLDKIETEDDIEKIALFMADIAAASPKTGLKLGNSIVEVFSSKTDKEKDIGTIGNCVWYIARASEEVGSKLANRIVNILSSRIEEEEDIEKIRSCLKNIAWADKEVGSKLFNNLSSRIEEEDIEKIRLCVANKEVGWKLANSINVESLSSRIEEEEDIEKIRLCVRDIAKANNKVGWKLANSINVESLSLRIEEEEDIEKIRLCVRDIAKANNKVGWKLANSINVESLSSRIEEVEDIKKISLCLRDIAWTNKEVGWKLANGIDVEILSSRIEEVEDIKKISLCLRDIARASEEVAQEITNRLNPKLRKELLKEGG